MTDDAVRIMTAGAGHRAAIRHVHEQAFGGGIEAGLVERLVANGAATLSLIALRGARGVGHILFSPVTIDAAGACHAVGLGPMGVLPAAQRRGIGGELVRAGLAQCRALGHTAVVVLGHAEYYPRFGFRPAAEYGLECEFDVPAEFFMALELTAGALAGVAGRVRYRPEFAAAA